MFKIGQKVICIHPYNYLLKKNKIYTIQDIITCCRVWLRFEGLCGPPDEEDNYCEYCNYYDPKEGDFFDSQYFRPIQSVSSELAQTLLNSIVEEKPDIVEIEQLT